MVACLDKMMVGIQQDVGRTGVTENSDKDTDLIDRRLATEKETEAVGPTESPTWVPAGQHVDGDGSCMAGPAEVEAMVGSCAAGPAGVEAVVGAPEAGQSSTDS